MGLYDDRKAATDAALPTNGANQIEAIDHRTVVKDNITHINDYWIRHKATPSTVPLAANRSMYFFEEQGLYTNFSSLVVNPGEIGYFWWNVTAWEKVVTFLFPTKSPFITTRRNQYEPADPQPSNGGARATITTTTQTVTMTIDAAVTGLVTFTVAAPHVIKSVFINDFSTNYSGTSGSTYKVRFDMGSVSPINKGTFETFRAPNIVYYSRENGGIDPPTEAAPYEFDPVLQKRHRIVNYGTGIIDIHILDIDIENEFGLFIDFNL